MGRRASQHVETNPAGSALVSRRQSAPVATLLLVSGSAAQGAVGRNIDARLRAAGSTPLELELQPADTRGKMWWAAVDSNHLPPRCSASSGLLLSVSTRKKGPVLSGLKGC